MQREIKFRGKRVDTEEWVYGNLLKLESGFFTDNNDKAYEWYIIPAITNGSWNKNNLMLKFISPCFEVIPETVGQYTGLKDKNGKEIYEGDIVCEEEGRLFTVKYGEHNTSEWNDNYELGFYVESNSEEEISRAIRTDIIFWVKYRDLEVIGNIYDNP